MSDAASLAAANAALREKIASLERKEVVVAQRVAAQVEKLTTENAVAAEQLQELKRTLETLKEEVAALDREAMGSTRRTASSSGTTRLPTSAASHHTQKMGSRRMGTVGSGLFASASPSGSPSGASPSPLRRPSAPTLDPAQLSSREVVASPPKSPTPGSGGMTRPQPPSMLRADSMPAFRERSSTTTGGPRKLTRSEGGSSLKSSKLAAILGEEIQELPVEDGIAYMRDKETDLVMVRGGTLDALIGKLLTAEGEGLAFSDAFLITYRSFIDPPALFEKLVARYAATFAVECDSGDKSQDRTRLKILAFFRTWVDKFFFDWDPDEFPTMLERYRHWLSTEVLGAQAKVAQQLTEAAERKTMRGGILRAENQFGVPAPKPVRPPLGFTRVTEIDATELARQFCLIESRLFQAIKPKEYLGKGWEAKNKDVVAPNLSRFIAHFNRIGNLIAHTVIDAPDEKRRVAVIEHWIKVGDKLNEMNNFSGVMEMIGGLGSTSVVRLKKTWKQVSSSKKKVWERLQQQMSATKAFANYRATIRAAQAPLIPYLGVYMQDMVFVEDGNPDFLKDRSDFINFHKRRLLADVIKDIVQYQMAPYNLEAVEEIVDFLQLQQPEPETVLYNKSLVLQPREAE